jgi:methyl-accepting chemotaxis protein
MNTVDFSTARFKHLNWKFRIRNFLDGKETLTEAQALTHTECDLGKWFYLEGKKKYGHLDSMQKFEAEHLVLHELVKAIRLAKNNADLIEAEKLYKDLIKTSDTLFELLNEAEKVINVG